MSTDQTVAARSAAEGSPGTAGDQQADWRVIRPHSRWWPGLGLGQLLSHRDLGLTFALRDLQLRYRQTLLGVVWAVLQPLLAMVAFSWVFGDLAGVPSEGVDYPVFVLAGVSVWFFISTAVTAASESLVEHADLVTRVWFPRLLAPTGAVLAALVDLLIGLLLLVPVMAIYGVAAPLQVLTLPVWILGVVLLATAVGFWLAAANVLYRDLRYAVAFLLQIWLFVSPVVFPPSLVGDAWQYVYAINPAVGLLEGLRWSLLGTAAPGPELIVSVCSLVLVFFGGVWYFRITERTFADRI
jgi:homopolymeric O-antigen transport system permease protein